MSIHTSFLTRGARPAGYGSRSVSQSLILSVTTILAPCVDSALEHRRGWSLRDVQMGLKRTEFSKRASLAS